MFRPIVVVATLSLLSGVATAEVRYRITDLGNFGAKYAEPKALNDRGEVIGTSMYPDMHFSAFYWSADTGMIDMTPQTQPPETRSGEAFDINNLGQVVGERRLGTGLAQARAFVWSKAHGLQTLGTLGGNWSIARGINNLGQVVGESDMGNARSRPFTWTAATGMQEFHEIASSTVWGINDIGQMVTYRTRWSPGIGEEPVPTLGGTYLDCRAINNIGHVVGESSTPEGGGNQVGHGFLYDGNVSRDLGHLGSNFSRALGINDHDEVVGSSHQFAEPTARAFYHNGSKMLDLNTLIDPADGWFLYIAYDINNVGQIVAIAHRPGISGHHALLLTPIPEPTLDALFVIASAFIARRRRRSRPARFCFVGPRV